jgi:hypothetical protein
MSKHHVYTRLQKVDMLDQIIIVNMKAYVIKFHEST